MKLGESKKIVVILLIAMLANTFTVLADVKGDTKFIPIKWSVKDKAGENIQSEKDLSVKIKTMEDFSEEVIMGVKLDSYKKKILYIDYPEEGKNEKHHLADELSKNKDSKYYIYRRDIDSQFKRYQYYKQSSIEKSGNILKIGFQFKSKEIQDMDIDDIEFEKIEIIVGNNPYFEEKGEEKYYKYNENLEVNMGYFTDEDGRMKIKKIEDIIIPTESQKEEIEEYLKKKGNPISESSESKSVNEFKLVGYRRCYEEDKYIAEKEYEFIKLIGLDKYIFLREKNKEIEDLEKILEDDKLTEKNIETKTEVKDKLQKLEEYPYSYEYKDGKMNIKVSSDIYKNDISEIDVSSSTENFIGKYGEDLLVEVENAEEVNKAKVVEGIRQNPLGSNFVSEILRGSYNLEAIKYKFEGEKIDPEAELEKNEKLLEDIEGKIDKSDYLNKVMDNFSNVDYSLGVEKIEEVEKPLRRSKRSLPDYNFRENDLSYRKAEIDKYFQGEEIDNTEKNFGLNKNTGKMFNQLEVDKGKTKSAMNECITASHDLFAAIQDLNSEIKDLEEDIKELGKNIKAKKEALEENRNNLKSLEEIDTNIGNINKKLVGLDFKKLTTISKAKIDGLIEEINTRENLDSKEELVELLEDLKNKVGDKEIDSEEIKSSIEVERENLEKLEQELKTSEEGLSSKIQDLKVKEEKLKGKKEELESLDFKVDLDKLSDGDGKKTKARKEKELEHLEYFANNYARLIFLDENKVDFKDYEDLREELLEQLEDTRSKLETYKLQKDEYDLKDKNLNYRDRKDKILNYKKVLNDSREALLNIVGQIYSFEKGKIADFIKINDDYKIKLGENSNLEILGEVLERISNYKDFKIDGDEYKLATSGKELGEEIESLVSIKKENKLIEEIQAMDISDENIEDLKTKLKKLKDEENQVLVDEILKMLYNEEKNIEEIRGELSKLKKIEEIPIDEEKIKAVNSIVEEALATKGEIEKIEINPKNPGEKKYISKKKKVTVEGEIETFEETSVSDELNAIDKSLTKYSKSIEGEIKNYKENINTSLNKGNLLYGEEFKLLYHIGEDKLVEENPAVYKYFNLPWIGITDVDSEFTQYEEVEINHIAGMYEKGKEDLFGSSQRHGNYWMFNPTVSWDGEKVSDKKVTTRIPKGSSLVLDLEKIEEELENKPPFVNPSEPFRLKLSHIEIGNDIIWRSEIEAGEIDKTLRKEGFQENGFYRLEEGSLKIYTNLFYEDDDYRSLFYLKNKLEEDLKVEKDDEIRREIEKRILEIEESMVLLEEKIMGKHVDQVENEDINKFKNKIKELEQEKIENPKWENHINEIIRETENIILELQVKILNKSLKLEKLNLVFEDELNQEYIVKYKDGEKNILRPVKLKKLKDSSIYLQAPEYIKDENDQVYKRLTDNKFKVDDTTKEIVFDYNPVESDEVDFKDIPGYYYDENYYSKNINEENNAREKSEKNNQANLGKDGEYINFEIQNRDLDICEKPNCGIKAHKFPSIGDMKKGFFNSQFYSLKDEEIEIDLSKHKDKYGRLPLGYSIEQGENKKGSHPKVKYFKDNNYKIKIGKSDYDNKDIEKIFINIYYKYSIWHNKEYDYKVSSVTHEYLSDYKFLDKNHEFSITEKENYMGNTSIRVTNDIYKHWEKFKTEVNHEDGEGNLIEKAPALDRLQAVSITTPDKSNKLLLDKNYEYVAEYEKDENGRDIKEGKDENGNVVKYMVKPKALDLSAAEKIDFHSKDSWKKYIYELRPGREQKFIFNYWFEEDTKLPEIDSDKYVDYVVKFNLFKEASSTYEEKTNYYNEINLDLYEINIDHTRTTEVENEGTLDRFKIYLEEAEGIKGKDLDKYVYAYSKPREEYLLLDKDSSKNVIDHFYYNTDTHSVAKFHANEGGFSEELKDNEFYTEENGKKIRNVIVPNGKWDKNNTPKVSKLGYDFKGWGIKVEEVKKDDKSHKIKNKDGKNLVAKVKVIEGVKDNKGKKVYDVFGANYDIAKVKTGLGRKIKDYEYEVKIGKEGSVLIDGIEVDTSGEEYIVGQKGDIKAFAEGVDLEFFAMWKKTPIVKPDPDPVDPDKPGGGTGGGGSDKDKDKEDPDVDVDVEPDDKPRPPITDEEKDLVDKYNKGDKSVRDRIKNLIIEEEVEYELNKIDHLAYIKGYPDETVKPGGNISREEVATVFYRLMLPEFRAAIETNENEFSDMDRSRWSNKAISTLTKGDIITGYPDGKFKPSNSITRGEVSTIAAKFTDVIVLDTKFKDVSGHWAEDYINSAEYQGWVKGYKDGSFRPNQNMTRSEFVSLVNGVLDRLVKKENILPGIKEFKDLEGMEWFYEAMVEAINGHDYDLQRLEDGSEVWIKLIDTEFPD